MHLDLLGNSSSATGQQRAVGRVLLTSPTPFPTSVLLPDINGWATWLCMECKHGIVSLKSDLHGSLSVNGHVIDYGGEGGHVPGRAVAYVEKNWGSSFPKTWMWIQSSNFHTTSTTGEVGAEAQVTGTLLLSVASIPFPSVANEWTRIRGFIGALWLPDHGGLYRFATYTGASIESLVIRWVPSHVLHAMRRDMMT